MTDEPDETPKKPRSSGAFLGGIIGMLMWFNQPGGLLNVGGITEWVAMAAFVGVFMVVGMLIERLLAGR